MALQWQEACPPRLPRLQPAGAPGRVSSPDGPGGGNGCSHGSGRTGVCVDGENTFGPVGGFDSAVSRPRPALVIAFQATVIAPINMSIEIAPPPCFQLKMLQTITYSRNIPPQAQVASTYRPNSDIASGSASPVAGALEVGWDPLGSDS